MTAHFGRPFGYKTRFLPYTDGGRVYSLALPELVHRRHSRKWTALIAFARPPQIKDPSPPAKAASASRELIGCALEAPKRLIAVLFSGEMQLAYEVGSWIHLSLKNFIVIVRAMAAASRMPKRPAMPSETRTISAEAPASRHASAITAAQLAPDSTRSAGYLFKCLFIIPICRGCSP